MNLLKGLATTLIPVLLLAAAAATSVQAQTPSALQAPSTSADSVTRPSGQAPDEMTQKITDLVHAGRYAEAQQLTTGLLIAFPNDQRLIKAKALLDKSLATAGATTATPGGNPAMSNETSTQPAANEKGGLLTGMDKVDYNALIQRAREAQQTTDLAEQKVLLKQFMDDSSQFLKKYPQQMLLWQLRTASAFSLDDITAGYEAGQKLLAMGAADSNDSNLQQLLAQLKNKGWLDKEEVEKQAKKYAPVGTWSLIINDDAETEQHEHKLSQSNGRWYGEGGGPATVEISRSDSAIRIDITTEDGVKHPYHLLRATVANSGGILWEGWTYLGWQPARSYELVDNDRTMRIVFSVVPTHKKSRSLPFANTDLQYTNTFLLHKN